MQTNGHLKDCVSTILFRLPFSFGDYYFYVQLTNTFAHILLADGKGDTQVEDIEQNCDS